MKLFCQIHIRACFGLLLLFRLCIGFISGPKKSLLVPKSPEPNMVLNRPLTEKYNPPNAIRAHRIQVLSLKPKKERDFPEPKYIQKWRGAKRFFMLIQLTLALKNFKKKSSASKYSFKEAA